MWRPIIYSLYNVHTHMNVSTVASWIQSVANHIYHISQAGIEMLASLCNLFSPHLCLLDPLIMQPCNDIVPGGQEPVSLTQIRLRMCFKTQQWKLPIKVKPSLETLVTSTIQISLTPSSRFTGLSHQSLQFVWAAGIEPWFPAYGAAMLHWANLSNF